MSKWFWSAFIVGVLFSRLLRGQASVTVSSTDPVYRDIDRLAAAGLVDTIIFGQQPYSTMDPAAKPRNPTTGEDLAGRQQRQMMT